MSQERQEPTEMNIMIAAVGPSFVPQGGGSDGALFVGYFAALGFLMLTAGWRVLRNGVSRSEGIARYTNIRN